MLPFIRFPLKTSRNTINRFYDVFRKYKKGTLGRYGLSSNLNSAIGQLSGYQQYLAICPVSIWTLLKARDNPKVICN